MRRENVLMRSNARLARCWWGTLSTETIAHLSDLTAKHFLSIRAGHLTLLNGRWFITNAGLLHIAQRRGCVGIKTILERESSDPNQSRWVFKAIVSKTRRSKSFEGYGDANPSNVSSIVRGAEMRVAETRAVNRALRKAYGIGVCSVEEIGAIPNPAEKLPPQSANGNAGPKVRDRLCQIIRQHQLDPELVKAYA